MDHLHAWIERVFVHPERLLWLWLVALCLVVVLASEAVGMRLRRRLFPQALAASSAVKQVFRKCTPAGARIAALLLVALAASDPRLGVGRLPVKPVNLQVVVLLDRSRSMAAEDVAPNRFEAGREHVRMLVEEAGGAAVALATFASSAHLDVPLTRDYRVFFERLDALAVAEGPPAGTNLQAGLEIAASGFAERMESPKMLVVITDGETHGEPLELSAVDLAPPTEVLVIGVGDAEHGARIPLAVEGSPGAGDERFLTFEGQTVRSRANPTLLRSLAGRFGGTFATHDTADAAIVELLEEATEAARSEAAMEYQRQAAPRFHWLLLTAFLLLCAETLLSAARSFTAPGLRRHERSAVTRAVVWLLLAGSLTALDTTLLSRAAAQAAGEAAGPDPPPAERQLSPRELRQLYNRGVTAYRAGRMPQAARCFARVRDEADDELRARARFNLANALFQIANRGGISQREAIVRMQTAIAMYRQSIAEGHRVEDARVNIELVYRRLLQIQQQSPGSQQEPTPPPEQDSPAEDQAEDQADSGAADSGDAARGEGEPRGSENSGDAKGNESGQDDGASEREPGPPGPASPAPDTAKPPRDRSPAPPAGGESRTTPASAPNAPVAPGTSRSGPTDPMTDEEAEHHLRQIRQRAGERARAGEGPSEEGVPPVRAPGGLPW